MQASRRCGAEMHSANASLSGDSTNTSQPVDGTTAWALSTSTPSRSRANE
jgi:hypothetical protein